MIQSCGEDERKPHLLSINTLLISGTRSVLRRIILSTVHNPSMKLTPSAFCAITADCLRRFPISQRRYMMTNPLHKKSQRNLKSKEKNHER